MSLNKEKYQIQTSDVACTYTHVAQAKLVIVVISNYRLP